MAVPDTSVFTLTHVTTEIGGGVTDLSTCFKNANNLYFDYEYAGDKDSLYNFRNYAATPTAVIIDIRTTPWYAGTITDPSHYNLVQMVYTYTLTGRSETVTRGVYKKSDDSALLSTAATSIYFFKTSTPKIAKVYNTHVGSISTDISLYNVIYPNYYWNSINPRIEYYSGTNPGWRKYFNLSNTANVSTNVNKTYIDFINSNASPSGSNAITLTSAEDWFFTIGESAPASGSGWLETDDPLWLSVDKWYGKGSDTVTVSVSDTDVSANLYAWGTTNYGPRIIKVTSWASAFVTKSPATMSFNAAGNPSGTDVITITYTSGAWAITEVNTGDGTAWISESVTSGYMSGSSTVSVLNNSGGPTRSCRLRVTSGNAISDCIVTQTG